MLLLLVSFATLALGELAYWIRDNFYQEPENFWIPFLGVVLAAIIVVALLYVWFPAVLVLSAAGGASLLRRIASRLG